MSSTMSRDKSQPSIFVHVIPVFILIFVLFLLNHIGQIVQAEPMPLTNVMPKILAIHEDAKSLLVSNTQLKSKILAGLNARIKETDNSNQTGNRQHATDKSTSTHNPKSATNLSKPLVLSPNSNLASSTSSDDEVDADDGSIDYKELEEFNSWVETNLEYAIKNTRASVDALTEEAAQNNGTVEYSEQTIKDGIEGIKYWQSAVIFQDKTLKNETFEQLD